MTICSASSLSLLHYICNVPLLERRLGQKKRVLMGLSDIQGWGAFLQQPAAKDEFVVRVWCVSAETASGREL